MSDLPRGWEWTTIDEVTATSLGKMLDKKQATGMHPTPYLRNINVRWGSFDLSDIAEMDIRPDELDRVLAQPGDVIACEGGEPGRAAVWTGPGTIALQKALHRIQPTEAILPAYLALLLQHLAMSRQLERFFTGTTIKHLPQEKLRLIGVPLPPRREQERIVGTIEEHLSRLAAAQAALGSVNLRLRRLVEGMMAAAFDREVPTVEIGQVADVGSGATPKRTESRYWDGGDIPWVTSGALNSPIVTEPTAYVTGAAVAETSVRLWPAGTVLVAMYGEGRTRGRAAELAFASTCNQACGAIRADLGVMRPRFLRWFLNAHYQQNRRLASGGVQPNLSLGLVKAMKVPLPSLEEQDRVVDGLEGSQEAADRFRRAIEMGRSRAGALRSSVLAAAFSGNLVPQDPLDEPASVLLERLRAERASAMTKRRRTVRAS